VRGDPEIGALTGLSKIPNIQGGVLIHD
jgi:hypothetical protein